MNSHFSGATIRFSQPGKISTLSSERKRVENLLEQKSLWLFSKANFNNSFKKEKVQPQVKWFDLFFASFRTTDNAFLFHFTFFLDCTDCFCGNDTLPGKVTEFGKYFLL